MSIKPLIQVSAFAAVGAYFLAASVACADQTSAELEISYDKAELPREETFTPHSYASMLSEVKPAVVSVYTANIVRDSQSNEEMLRRFFGYPPAPNRGRSAEPESEERRLPQGVGSGVVLTSDGYIITNSHVISDQRGSEADEILVRLNDGRELSAEIIGRDPKTDVALLKVDATDLPTVQVANSDEIEVGDIVFAIGNPMQVGITVTQGIVSATGRAIGIYGAEGYENFIQTDASINPGNSGGALVDSLGRLIGINSAIVSRTGGNIGIGFAIPSNLAVNISQQLNSNGEVSRGYIGVRMSGVTPDIAEAFGIENQTGVLIDEVQEGFAAEKAGIERGDIITHVNGVRVESPNQFRVRVAQTPPGTSLEFGLIRDGDAITLDITIGDRGGVLADSGRLFEGVSSAMLDDDSRDEFDIPDSIDGLLITEVASSSPYSRSLNKGMVIMEINDQDFDTPRDAMRLWREGVNKLYIFDRGRVGYIAVRQ